MECCLPRLPCFWEEIEREVDTLRKNIIESIELLNRDSFVIFIDDFEFINEKEAEILFDSKFIPQITGFKDSYLKKGGCPYFFNINLYYINYDIQH